MSQIDEAVPTQETVLELRGKVLSLALPFDSTGRQTGGSPINPQAIK